MKASPRKIAGWLFTISAPSRYCMKTNFGKRHIKLPSLALSVVNSEQAFMFEVIIAK